METSKAHPEHRRGGWFENRKKRAKAWASRHMFAIKATSLAVVLLTYTTKEVLRDDAKAILDAQNSARTSYRNETELFNLYMVLQRMEGAVDSVGPIAEALKKVGISNPPEFEQLDELSFRLKWKKGSLDQLNTLNEAISGERKQANESTILKGESRIDSIQKQIDALKLNWHFTEPVAAGVIDENEIRNQALVMTIAKEVIDEEREQVQIVQTVFYRAEEYNKLADFRFKWLSRFSIVLYVFGIAGSFLGDLLGIRAPVEG
jgi:hypothetical protein